MKDNLIYLQLFTIIILPLSQSGTCFSSTSVYIREVCDAHADCIFCKQANLSAIQASYNTQVIFMVTWAMLRHKCSLQSVD